MRKRLDQLVCERGLIESRERAKTMIMAGLVFVDGQRVDKPGAQVAENAALELRGESLPYVSRGGLKLEKALRVFAVHPAGQICLDCGASTGGFTDVLLQNGAKKVYAVDVGYGQLAWSLRTDPRVVNLERTNARYLGREQVPEEIGLAAMDLSFISLRLVLPAVHALLAEAGDVIALIKPQFEAGREKVGKKGVVRSADTHLEVLRGLLAAFPTLGFTAAGLDYSPVKGPEGNIEFLCWLKKGIFAAPELHPERVVQAAHGEL
ncbi:MAG: TlyA family RNA methyltransferase [Firmicutes bacterium]|nr:TlyA family RNA methyltransferase [Bacillota bacterium]